MLPRGAVHIPCRYLYAPLTSTADLYCTDKGVQKIARKLGINYAEAVVSETLFWVELRAHLHTLTGFEFKKRRAFPVVEGVVIASENEQMLLDVRRILLYQTLS